MTSPTPTIPRGLREAVRDFATQEDQEAQAFANKTEDVEGRREILAPRRYFSTSPVLRTVVGFLQNGKLLAYGRSAAGAHVRVPANIWRDHEFEFFFETSLARQTHRQFEIRDICIVLADDNRDLIDWTSLPEGLLPTGALERATTQAILRLWLSDPQTRIMKNKALQKKFESSLPQIPSDGTYDRAKKAARRILPFLEAK